MGFSFNVLHWFLRLKPSVLAAMLAMIWTIGFLGKHPEVQRKAQAELLAHYPNRELPDVDSENLVYIHAMAKEASRLFNVFRICLPRTSLTDVTYRTAMIPAGTTFFLNSWACNLDAEKFPDPFEFKPERFISRTANASNANNHVGGGGMDSYAFGMGRRMCPGVFLALREIYTTLVFLTHFFDIEPDGEYDIHPLTAVEDGRAFSVRPKPFKVRCIPRPGVDLSPLLDHQ